MQTLSENREMRKTMKANFERAKWFPIFILAVILMLIYSMIGNFTTITTQIGRFIGVLSPLFFGILFSYFLFIPHRFVEKLFSKVRIKFIARKARLFATLVIFVVLVVAVVLIVSYLLPVVVTSVLDLANSVPGYVSFIADYIDNIPEDSIWSTLNIVDSFTSNAGDLVNQVFNTGTIEQFASSIIGFANQIFSLIIGMIISLYMLLDRDRILEFFRRLNDAVFKNDKVRDRNYKYMQQVNKVLFTFIASKGLDSIINFVVVTTILLIFNVPYAILLGLMAGVFNFIPYLGSLIAVIAIVLITLLADDFTTAVQVLIPLLVFQQIDGNFIEPRIMKSSLKISPILVIIAVVAGGAYFGIAGMFLAVPIAVIIKQILLEYISHAENPDHNDE